MFVHMFGLFKGKSTEKDKEAMQQADPFFAAIEKGDVTLVAELMEKDEGEKDAAASGANDNKGPSWMNRRDDLNRTPLMAACRFKNIDMVELFLNETTLWEITTPSRNPALEQLSKIRWMFWIAGIKVNQTQMRKHAPFVIAAEEGNLEVLELLWRFAGADPNLLNRNEGTTALRSACMRGHIDCVEWLLKQGADASLPNTETGSTPLLVAVLFKHEDVVKCLLEHRTAEELCFYEARTTNDGINEGTSIYMAAAGGRNSSLMKILLDFDKCEETKEKKEILLHAVNAKGWTALDHAIVHQSMGIKEAHEIAELLLAEGAKAKPETFGRSLFMGGGFTSLSKLWSHRSWGKSHDSEVSKTDS